MATTSYDSSKQTLPGCCSTDISNLPYSASQGVANPQARSESAGKRRYFRGVADSDRTSETAERAQIRSLKPFRLIPSEPRRNWFGRKITHIFSGLKNLRRRLV